MFPLITALLEAFDNHPDAADTTPGVPPTPDNRMWDIYVKKILNAKSNWFAYTSVDHAPPIRDDEYQWYAYVPTPTAPPQAQQLLDKLAKSFRHVCAQNPRQAVDYASVMRLKRFPEAEAAIAKSAEYSYLYAEEVIKGRFPEGEPVIATNASTSQQYANLLADRGILLRWPPK